MKTIRRIGITTGGGDAPGLNAVVRAATLAALRRGLEVIGIRRGYAGLFDHAEVTKLDDVMVRGITHLGGSILGSNSKGNPFRTIEHDSSGREISVDRMPLALEGIRLLGLDGIVAIGGDGSMKLAHQLHSHGVPIVGVPKTIDNDLSGTVVTFGFDTAVQVAAEAIDRLHSTAEAHERVFVVELMGRYAGWIALHAGVAATADVVLIPEIPYDIESVCTKIRQRELRGRHFSIVVAAEGARPIGGELTVRVPREGDREQRLGGIAEKLAQQIAERTGKETRSLVLGHLQRGGMPTARDRMIALCFGAAAVAALVEGNFGTMVAVDPPEIRTVPLGEAIARRKTVPLDDPGVRTARDLGVCLGD